MSLSHSPKIVTNGLVLCLDAADKKSYPGTGTLWTDRSGNGNNGTLTNGPTFSSANGGSIVFDGTNDYVDTAPIIASNGFFTISSWVYLASGAGNFPMIASVKSGDGISFFGIRIGSNNALGFNLYLNGLQTNNQNVPLINTWYNAVAVYDGSAKVYVNSVLLSQSSAGSSAGFPSGVWIGNGSLLGNSFWKGNIAQTSIYNRALTPQEILQNFNATRGRYGI
jgi:hypothetical protein